jgi:hypothetical protein
MPSCETRIQEAANKDALLIHFARLQSEVPHGSLLLRCQVTGRELSRPALGDGGKNQGNSLLWFSGCDPEPSPRTASKIVRRHFHDRKFFAE